MKKIIKNNIFGFILGGIIFGFIGVGAAGYMYYSEQVSYKKPDNTETDVKTALDELYNTYDGVGNVEDITVSDLMSSGTGVTSATLTHTFTEDVVVGVSYIAGASNYTVTLTKNGQAINANNFWTFGLYPQMTKLINIKKGDTLTITISGDTAAQYSYYKVFMGTFNY